MVGDDDGVVIVPLALHKGVMDQALDRLKMERQWVDAIASGKSTAELMGLPKSEPIG